MSRRQLLILLVTLGLAAPLVLLLGNSLEGQPEEPVGDAADAEEVVADPVDVFRLLDDVAGQPGAAPEEAGRIATFALEQEEVGHVYTEAQAVDAAQRFDLITALRGSYRDHVEAMRAANPDLVLSVYLNAAFAQVNQESSYPDAWYLRDADGEKVTNDFDLWMMDVGNPEWQQDRVETCEAFLVESGYDGCFLDNLGWGTLFPPSLSNQPINPRTGLEYTNEDWISDTRDLSAQVLASMPEGGHVIANGLVSGAKFFDVTGPTDILLDVADFGLAETFIRPAGLGPDESRPEDVWRQDVDMLVAASADDRRVMAVTKIWRDDATAADVDRWHEFSLASFMLGNDGRHWFSFSGDRLSSKLATHPWWDTELGAAEGPYVRTDDGLYARRFAEGLVLVNPTDQTIELELNGTYLALDDAETTMVVLEPQDAAVLRTTS